jgi:hypothetical protein
MQHELLTYISLVVYLTTLPVLRLYRPDYRIINECGAVNGMRIGRKYQSTLRKAASLALCSSPIPYGLPEIEPLPTK